MVRRPDRDDQIEVTFSKQTSKILNNRALIAGLGKPRAGAVASVLVRNRTRAEADQPREGAAEAVALRV